jgi:CheY-like chemotaxis protein
MANARKILIVDDDTDLRDTLVEQLSLHDEFEASAVDTGAKGASAAKANAPDLVLMDVGLPDTDGREVVRSLRKGGFKAPIIMLTGHTRIRTPSSGSNPAPMIMSQSPSASRCCWRESVRNFVSTRRAKTRCFRWGPTAFGPARRC